MSETHFDVFFVGSGFGGSVMAYRLAKAGLRGAAGAALQQMGQKYG